MAVSVGSGVAVGESVAGTGVGGGGVVVGRQAARENAKSTSKTRFTICILFSIVIQINRLGIYDIIIAFNDIHIAGQFLHMFLHHFGRTEFDK